MKKKKNQSNVWFKEGVWNFFFLPFLYFSPRPTTKKSNLATTEEPIKAFFFVSFFSFSFSFLQWEPKKSFSLQFSSRRPGDLGSDSSDSWSPEVRVRNSVWSLDQITEREKKPSRAEQQRRDPSRPPALPEHFNGAENYLPASASFFFFKVCSCKKKKKKCLNSVSSSN